MRSLTLESLTIRSFKAITHAVTFSFTATTRITGDNGQGKSSVADAIVWSLFGVNRAGSPQVDAWIPAVSGHLAAEVTFFGLDGRRHTLHRHKDAKRTTIRLDGRPVPQTECAAAVGSVTTFLAAFDPTWWLDQKESDLRRFCLSLLPPVDPETVRLTMGQHADPLTAWPGDWFADVPGTLVTLRRDLKAVTTDRHRNEGARALLEPDLHTPPPPVPDGTRASVDAAQAALSAAMAAPLAVDGLVDVTPLQAAVARARVALPDRPPDWEDPSPLETALSAHRRTEPDRPDETARFAAQLHSAE